MLAVYVDDLPVRIQVAAW